MIQRSDTIFLKELGQRILTARNLRGLSRRTLAQMSGISERYIALLESGRGNISIVLLRRVSSAMAVPLTDLIPSGKLMGRCHPIHAPADGKALIGHAQTTP